MGWATAYIEKLIAGETVQFRPRGNSMVGKIDSGQLCTVEPVDPEQIKTGDIVLCKVGRAEYLHLVKAVRPARQCSTGRCGPKRSTRSAFLIGNNKGGTNGWTTNIYGKCVKVEP